jgi:hypothetical protein
MRARAGHRTRPGGEQHLTVLRQTAERRGEREADDPGHERPLAAPVVGNPTTEQEQATEGQGVRGDHPLPVAVGDVKCLLGVWQRDVDHGRVEHHHQLRNRDDREGPPAPGVRALGGAFLAHPLDDRVAHEATPVPSPSTVRDSDRTVAVTYVAESTVTRTDACLLPMNHVHAIVRTAGCGLRVVTCF